MTKALRSTLFLTGLFFAATANAQNCADQYLGTKTLYQPQQTKYTAAPAGYQPVYINHVGRHGARHLTKDVAISYAYNLLINADSAKALTAEGYKLEAMVDMLQRVEKKNVKFISARGAEEQKGIGQRMMANYHNVFDGRKECLTITITKEERTRQSADAFLKGLNYQADCKPEFIVNNDDLRFFSIAPAYADFESNGSWNDAYNKLESAVRPANFNDRFLTRFFKKEFYAKLENEKQTTFIDDIDGFGAIVNSIQKEIADAGYKPGDLDILKLFTCDELRVLDELGSADDFLKKSPGIDKNGIQVRDAVPLLVSFINTTDNFITNHTTAANLRFAHAETIAPIAALMDIKSASEPATDILTYGKVWSAARVIPLSSNIQWVLYKNSAGNHLVKIMLNEKEVALNGITTKTFPYYQWNDVKKYYLNKLNALHVKLTDDMHAYLMALK